MERDLGIGRTWNPPTRKKTFSSENSSRSDTVACACIRQVGLGMSQLPHFENMDPVGMQHVLGR